MQSSTIHLKRVTSITSIAIALAIVTIFPLLYFFTALSYEKRMLDEQSLIAADQLSKYIFDHPQSWQFQHHRLQDILSKAPWRHSQLLYSVYDIDHTAIAKVGKQPPPPYHTRQATLLDNEKPVGYVQIHTSQRPLLLKTTATFLAALLVAAMVYYTLRILPFAALKRVMKSLERSQQQLTREIIRKDNALKENRKINDELHYRAMHDPLTTLANRDEFYSTLHRFLKLAKNNDSAAAILLLDLNRFKDVNDSLGHQIGDQLLVAISRILQRAVPENGVLARLGGDEFALALTNTNLSEALQQAELITQTLRTHIVIDDYHIAASASIGIACYPQHGTSQTVLLRNADLAMYHAKQTSKPYALYDENYQDNSPNRLILTAALHHALDNSRLSLVYQPKIELSNGNMIGTEALCRWIDPQHGFVAPDVFIPIAEEAGMINVLTAYVMELSLAQLARWHQSGMRISVAVNISARNLQNENFPAQIKSLLEKYEIEPHYLNLEITESSIMIDPEKSRELLNLIAKWGVKISIDDFGTGYSSLTYLKKLAVDELKIDRSFVMNMFNENDDRIIVQSTITLAHNLGIKVVAEGIGNQETYNLLQQYGCDYVQGYHILAPSAAEEIEHWNHSRSGKAANI